MCIGWPALAFWGARCRGRMCMWSAARTIPTGRWPSPAGSARFRWISPWCRRSIPTSSSGCGCRGAIDEAQELLGHALASSTQVYAHPDPARLRAAVDAVPGPGEAAGGARGRGWVAPGAGLGFTGGDGARLGGRAGPAGKAGRDAPRPVLGPGKCAVVACLRAGKVHPGPPEACCPVHATRWEAASHADPGLEERRWRQIAEPLPVPGHVNLRGLAPLVVAEVLYGLQQRGAAQCTSHCRFLRRLAQELRQAQG